MNKQYFGSAFTLANAQRIGLKVSALLLLLGFVNACELISKGSGPSIPKDNPGLNTSLSNDFASDATENSHRMRYAVNRVQYCPNATPPCTQIDKNFITYNYDTSAPGFLDNVVEETTVNNGREVTSRRQYHYSDSDGDLSVDRLDKVSVRLNDNFHTLHDYFYDDEDDGSFKALNHSRPKLRKEYICDIDLVAVTTEVCNRDNASEVINYIFNANGYLYRKEFDVNNDTKIEHQKIYHYENNVLTRVDTDNFYNGKIDERYEYERSDDLGLRVFIDNGYVAKLTRGIDKAISYRNDYTERHTANVGETVFGYTFFLADPAPTHSIQVSLNDTVLSEPADYTVNNNNTSTPFGGSITLATPAADGDVIELSAPDNAYDTVITKECYFNRESAKECLNNSTENHQWIFTWELNDCWAGGLDDIDPEARAIDYLCKQGG